MPLTELRPMQTIGALLELATQNGHKTQSESVVGVLGDRSDTIQRLDTTGIRLQSRTLDTLDFNV